MLEILNGNLPKKESGLQAAFTTPGTYYWTVPAGVTSISAVAVGGGASLPSSGRAPINALGGAVRIVWGAGRNYPNYVPDV